MNLVKNLVNKPSKKPSNKPGNKPGNKPDNKPGILFLIQKPSKVPSLPWTQPQ